VNIQSGAPEPKTRPGASLGPQGYEFQRTGRRFKSRAKGPWKRECQRRGCGIEFETKHPNAIYCPEHKRIGTRGEMSAFPDTPYGSIGACSELSVAVDLLACGFEVYRNVSNHGSLDLIAVGPAGEILRIEVTTGQILMTGNHTGFNSHAKTRGRWTHLAIVTRDGIKWHDAAGNPVAPPSPAGLRRSGVVGRPNGHAETVASVGLPSSSTEDAAEGHPQDI
jgi:hypothetical protein